MRDKRYVGGGWFWGLVGAIVGLLFIVAAYYLYTQPMNTDDTTDTTYIDPIQEQLNSLTLEQKIASLLMLHVAGTDAQYLANFVEKYQPGGMILMRDNIPSDVAATRQLVDHIQTAALPYPLFIAVDEEGCSVQRLPEDTFKCATELGRLDSAETEDAFKQRSQLLYQAGVNLNFGIVADITDDQESFIYPRVFGPDPVRVGEYIAAAVQGSKGLTYSTLKHFPGHGKTAADSHFSVPQVAISKEKWLASDAVPFISGIGAGAEAIMFGHLVFPEIDSLPASLSPVWHQILTNDLKFKGLAVTDDLIMLQQSNIPHYQDPVQNVITAIKAGNNINVLVTDHDATNQPHTVIDIQALIAGVAEQVKSGQLSRLNIDNLVYQNLAWRSGLSTR